ncbi:MAG TPA: regulatory signaling modulator protein AmpE [Gammaproteobacteria bacterium]|nr:regulatory signaling modulator protein AmpE [Gammaproteobacteria bacterium]
MVFIAILMALALERFFDWSHLRSWQWFDRYCQMLSPVLDRLPPLVRLICWLLPPILVVGLVQHLLSGWFFGLFCLLFDFIILLYCFGPANFWADSYNCLQAMSQGDARLVDERLNAAFPEVGTPTPQTLHKTVVRAIYLEGERRVFAVLFWFSILGPMGALLYRLIVLANSKTLSDMAVLSAQALKIIEWLPARLLSFLFALGGHFVKVLQIFKKYALQGLDSNEVLISETGLVALDLPANKPLPENGEVEKQAIQLFDRTLFIMLVLSALLVLAWP